ncbi:MAG: hypothetical protein QX190_05355 [Methylococcales bacterium]
MNSNRLKCTVVLGIVQLVKIVVAESDRVIVAEHLSGAGLAFFMAVSTLGGMNIPPLIPPAMAVCQ